MKRKILSALAALAALAFASCSNLNNDEHTEVVTGTNGSIKINLADSSRTALPAVSDAEEFTSFTLTGTTTTAGAASISKTSWETVGTESAYAKMTAANIMVTVGADYTFTLTAEKGGAKWQGSTTKTIARGTNNLSFALELSSISKNGTGSLSVTLTVPASVKAVDATLKALDESTSISPEGASTVLAGGKVTYTADEIASGNYVLVFTLYADTEKTLKLGEWREYAGITNGITSSSNAEISGSGEGSLQNIFTITLNTSDGTLTGTVPGSYTMYSNSITLPTASEISKANYDFEGWYDAETGGNKVESIAAGSTGNKTLYARWTPSIVAVTGLSLDKTTTQTVDVGTSISFTATVAPDNATDKTVKWSVSGTGVMLYSDSACSAAITTDTATSTLIVYAKGTATGNATVTVTSNADSTKSASCDVTVQGFHVGDVLLWDGTVVPYDANRTFTSEQKYKAVCVLAYFNDKGIPVGLGLKNSAADMKNGSYKWATRTTGYQTKFADIICTPSQTGSGAAREATFTGDTDGSNNWTYICSLDPIGSADFYPAFNYVNKNHFVAGPRTYDLGWYMPSIAELCYIYRNKATVNAVIKALGGTELEGTYWSSSQVNDASDNAWYLNISDGFIRNNNYYGGKDQDYRVCCVRAFTTTTDMTKIVTIKFDSDGGSPVNEISGNYGTEVTLPTAPTKEGYIFKGWSPALSEIFTENLTVKALWEETIIYSVEEAKSKGKIGDVLLNDGTVVSYTGNITFTDEQKKKAVCVLAYFNDKEEPVGLGVHNSESYYAWAKKDTNAYNWSFETDCTPSNFKADKASFYPKNDDTDGSDNWACIENTYSRLESGKSEKPAEDCPAFDYVNKYAETFSLTGNYTTGWYMPSIAELCYIYRNKATVNAVLEALGGTGFYYYNYWSSSSVYGKDSNNHAWYLNVYAGTLQSANKDYNARVCCVRAFSN